MTLDARIAQLTTTSLSDIKSYRQVCAAAASNDEVFAVFRSLPAYRQILEHVDEKLGAAYLAELEKFYGTPLLATRFFAPFLLNDAYGSPERFEYSDIGRVSPTTLRYAFVAMELNRRFGDLNGQRVIEVGGGYGGQARILHDLFGARCTIVDLPEPGELAARFLIACGVDDVQIIDGLELHRSIGGYLFLSNYALTECAPPVVESYVQKLALNCEHGYITGNAQRELLAELLVSKRSKFEVEAPSSFLGNYVCTW